MGPVRSGAGVVIALRSRGLFGPLAVLVDQGERRLRDLVSERVDEHALLALHLGALVVPVDFRVALGKRPVNGVIAKRGEGSLGVELRSGRRG